MKANKALMKALREIAALDMKSRPPVCYCKCHKDGHEDHGECCFYQAARERDQARLDLQGAQIRSGEIVPLARQG